MKVLFWLNSFPTVSETFIRNQVISLIDNDIDVSIICHKKNNSERILEDYLEYNLLNKTKSIEELLPQNYLVRVFKCIKILISNIFSKRVFFLIKSLNIYKFGSKAKRLEYFFLVDYIISNKIEIIHCHYGTVANEVVFLKKIGIPFKLICTFHGYDIRLGLDKGKSLYKELFFYVDIVISISNYNKEKLLFLGLKKQKIVSLNNGVEIPKQIKKEKDDKNNPIKVLSVGRLVDEKGYDLALKAIHLFITRNPDIKFVYSIVGDGKLKNELIELSTQLKLNEIIKFLLSKNSKDIYTLLQETDVFLLTSKKEAIPTVILEAFANSLPVVATNVGSVKDIVIDGETGYLSSIDVESICYSFEKMINNHEKWENMGRKGRMLVEKEYNNLIQTERLLKIYNS